MSNRWYILSSSKTLDDRSPQTYLLAPLDMNRNEDRSWEDLDWSRNNYEESSREMDQMARRRGFVGDSGSFQPMVSSLPCME